ncbi:MAG: ketopantoate reductase family protein, partial [Candidatus Heimdallarchaeota archaeon]
AMLYKKGIDVTVVTRKGTHFDSIKKDGLTIEGYDEPFYFPIYSSFKDLKGTFKHVLVIVKNPSTAEVTKKLKKVITKNSLVYSLQNGFGNTDIMAKHIPRNQIVAGVIGWGATYLGNGKLSIASESGDFVLGFEDGKNTNDPRLLVIKEILDIWKPTILTSNIIGYRWAKLIVNSILAPIGGLLGLTLGYMIKHKEIGPILGDMKNEAIQVADAHNIKLEKVDGLNIRNFFYKPKASDGPFKRLSGNIMSTIIANVGAKRHGKIYPSLLTDLNRGKKTEIAYLNGYIAQKGKEVNLETPISTFLVKAITEIEKGKRKIGLQNLPELKAIAKISREKINEQESAPENK